MEQMAVVSLFHRVSHDADYCGFVLEYDYGGFWLRGKKENGFNEDAKIFSSKDLWAIDAFIEGAVRMFHTQNFEHNINKVRKQND